MIYLLAIALTLTLWKYTAMVRCEGLLFVMRHLIAALCAGLLSGILLGLSARIAMRVLALTLDVPLRQTVAGSFTVIAAFTAWGMVLSLPYAALFNGVGKRGSLVYAALLIVLTLQPFIRTAADDLNASMWEPRVIGGAVAITVVMWLPYALALAASFTQLYRKLARLMNSRQFAPQAAS